MADFKLPNLGEGVESGDVVGLSVKAGDSVTKGQSMLEVETNKAVMDVPAPADAKITAVHVKVGDKVKPGQVVVAYEAAAAGAKPAVEHAHVPDAKSADQRSAPRPGTPVAPAPAAAIAPAPAP